MIGDFKFYELGGKIRDELLGLTNKSQTNENIVNLLNNLLLNGKI